MVVKSKRGGKRPGSGRRPGTPNKSTVSLKNMASEYTAEAVKVLVEVMRDPESPPAVKIQAADKLLDRGHGRPAITIDPQEINLNVFPPKEVLDGIYAKALEEAAKRDQMLIGRRERLGISIDRD
ncbi:MAG: hypothetical protein Q7T96_19910 [Methylobacter sp.]|nr:hypothetical protein [Methylobacter sp.]